MFLKHRDNTVFFISPSFFTSWKWECLIVCSIYIVLILFSNLKITVLRIYWKLSYTSVCYTSYYNITYTVEHFRRYISLCVCYHFGMLIYVWNRRQKCFFIKLVLINRFLKLSFSFSHTAERDLFFHCFQWNYDVFSIIFNLEFRVFVFHQSPIPPQICMSLLGLQFKFPSL